MKSLNLQSKTSSHLWPVVFLLAVAVILPTVCLLWFISQAVKNERFAVRQKLADIYEKKLAEANQNLNLDYISKLTKLEKIATQPDTYKAFNTLVIKQGYNGFILYDKDGKIIYPTLSTQPTIQANYQQQFRYAWDLEFGNKEPSKAIEVYEQIAQSYDDYIKGLAIIGKSRCLAKIGQYNKAIESLKFLILMDMQTISDSNLLALICDGCLLLVELLEQGNISDIELKQQTENILDSILFATNRAGASLPADKNLFVADKLLKMLKKDAAPDELESKLAYRIKKLTFAEQLSIEVADNLSESVRLNWQRRPKRFDADGQMVYGFKKQVQDKAAIVLISQDNIERFLSALVSELAEADILYRLVDDTGRFVAGVEDIKTRPFIDTSLQDNFANWKLELHFPDGEVFDRAANRQIALYTWSGVLVIVLILTAGALAIRAVGKQIKLNKLKNDFIATVSHELKTPLASMRVLVDTLLEGNFEDQKQATEYLQLTSKENERLSRLIDNFLTFSRMESGKQRFEFSRINPAVIAQEAADSAGAKFDKEQCKFDIDIEDNLPDVSADKDAIVTVLVNLLDNAYKYTGSDKQISLKVFAEDNLVCFQVTDNGVGMSKRAVKKIFGRFYQADRTLSRQAGGTGLGLSIVKFIVDAHKGQITVDSKPGKGSTFTVKLQTAKQD